MPTREDMLARIENDFTYHPPSANQVPRYEMIRATAKQFALVIVNLTPPSDEQKLALDLLGLAVMEANAAIARNE